MEAVGRDDDILEATPDMKETVGVALDAIAGAKPSILERLRRRLGVIEVSRGDIVPPDPQLPVRLDADLLARQRPADASPPAGERVADADDRRRLGQTVPLHDEIAASIPERFHRRVESGAAAPP